MASLDDYNWQESRRRRSPRRRFLGLWAQGIVSVALLLGIAGLIGSEGAGGQVARYVVGDGLEAGSSWFSFGREQPAIPAQAQLTDAAGSQSGQGAAPGAGPEQPVANAPRFLAPASGVVIKGMKLDEAGLTSDQGIIIQGVAGQSVKAAAAGEVYYMGESESGFIVELRHENGFSSVYQGLSELAVIAGQQVAAGDTIGVTASGELLFALFLDGVEVDPLLYLFQQQV